MIRVAFVPLLFLPAVAVLAGVVKATPYDVNAAFHAETRTMGAPTSDADC